MDTRTMEILATAILSGAMALTIIKLLAPNRFRRLPLAQVLMFGGVTLAAYVGMTESIAAAVFVAATILCAVALGSAVVHGLAERTRSLRADGMALPSLLLVCAAVLVLGGVSAMH